MKTKFIIILALVLTLAACAPKPTPTPAVTEPPSGTSMETEEVKIQGFTFDPIELTIAAGTTVKWTNMDSARHTITSNDGSWGSANLSQGGTFEFTFDQPGTYTYHCNVHPTMAATIIVTP
jgi:plastocyanin